VKAIWELHLAMELEHLRVAADMMRQIEKREPEQLIMAGDIRPLVIKENKAWLRHIL
jgi:hypothetical protein